MGHRLHPREAIVNRADSELRRIVADWQDGHDLTEAEELSVLTSVFSRSIGSIAKYAIREERHGNPGEPGGLE